ncbi:hypothetical protein NDR87_33095 [Nocardia sp. CDC159]|uniref:Uncharacterized protein n=1 Tax=Nocardia pulmonis TaxID=2951408 RepID=A0A9X2EDE1_9NOCA|nr:MULTISPECIES: hypothetical protein [Nocardia]MCM6778384.1 hypothetical protein [Nocardia pulmonis]MCM6791220.1 hypothetical protein [Nocardia sp. CDC159]
MLTALKQALRRIFGRKVSVGGPPELGGGGSAGVREPRRPVPPTPHLRGAQNIPPDSDPVSLPGADR